MPDDPKNLKDFNLNFEDLDLTLDEEGKALVKKLSETFSTFSADEFQEWMDKAEDLVVRQRWQSQATELILYALRVGAIVAQSVV